MTTTDARTPGPVGAAPTHDDPRAFFEAHGYWTTPSLVEPSVVADALDGARAVQRGESPSGVPPMIVHATPDGKPGLCKVDNAWWGDERLWALVLHPEIGRQAAELLGCDEVFLWHDQLLIKPPSVGGVANVGWHQDRYYWSILGGHDIITAWVPLADVGADMGPLRFVDGSHRWGIRTDVEGFTPADGHEGPSVEEQHASEDWREHTVLLPAGGVSFHSPFTMHGSGPNTSDRDRPGLALHLIGSDVTIRRGRLHSAQVLSTAGEGEPYRGPRTPRIWPPDPQPLDLLGDLDDDTRRHWQDGSRITAAFRSAHEVAMTGPLWSWYAGRDDERPLGTTIDHPLRTLVDAATLRPGKHVAISRGALGVVELLPEAEWSGHVHSPAVVAEAVLDSVDAMTGDERVDLTLLDATVETAERLLRPPSAR